MYFAVGCATDRDVLKDRAFGADEMLSAEVGIDVANLIWRFERPNCTEDATLRVKTDRIEAI